MGPLPTDAGGQRGCWKLLCSTGTAAWAFNGSSLTCLTTSGN